MIAQLKLQFTGNHNAHNYEQLFTPPQKRTLEPLPYPIAVALQLLLLLHYFTQKCNITITINLPDDQNQELPPIIKKHIKNIKTPQKEKIFTPKQMEILYYTSHGYTRKQISQIINLPEPNIDQIHKTMKKNTNMNTIGGVLGYAYREGHFFNPIFNPHLKNPLSKTEK